MKRASHLFEVIVSDVNLDLAIYEVNRTHRWRRPGIPNRCTRWVEKTADQRKKDLRAIIEAGFEPAPAKVMERYDSNARKYRTIYEPPQWPDQYVHHALVQAIQPVCMRGMDPWCCGSIRGRGIHYGKRGLEKWIRHDQRNTRYCLTADIYHFYDELPPEEVVARFRHLIKDRRALDLIERIVAGGIKAGYYPSQWFANTFLQPLDRLIREDDSCKHYVRYMDNITVLGSNKRKMRRLRAAIDFWLREHGLRLKGDWQIFAVKDRLPDALGYRYGRTYTIPRKRSYLKLKRSVAKYRKLKRKGKRVPRRLAAGILSRLGQVKHCSNVNIYRAVLQGERLQRDLKRIVRNADRAIRDRRGY